MAYYASVISLQQTIDRLRYSSRISILPSSREILEFAYERVCSLLQVLQKLGSSSYNSNSEVVGSLREQITEAAYKLEDAIESHISDQSLGDDGSSLVFSLDLNEVLKQDISSFTSTVKKMEDKCSKQLDLELSNPLPDQEDDVDFSRIDFRGMESEMVGLSYEFSHLKKRLLNDRIGGSALPISGMVGIGKTTFARKIYQDPEISSYFDCRMWVTIGPKYQHRKIMLGILAQLGHDVDYKQIEGDEQLAKYLHTSTKSTRYLIVLDDVWNEEDWKKLLECLSFNRGSHALLITRLRHIADNINPLRSYKMRFLNKEESWRLLREKVFGKESCPLQLEKAGKKIAQNCDGLPLLIVTVANRL